MMPANIYEKTGDSVAAVLQSKHPNARTLDASLLLTYSDTADFVDLDMNMLPNNSLEALALTGQIIMH